VPSLPFVPGVAKVIVKQTLAGVNAYNVLHVDGGAGTGWTSTELNALASAVRSAYVTNFIPLQTSQLTLNEVTAIDLASDTGPSGVATGTTFGAVGTQALGGNTAVGITWAIARRYRGGHPRTYIAGPVGTQTSNANSLTTTAQTSYANAAAALRTAINAVTTSAGSAKFCCVHYYRNGAILATPLVSQITGSSVDLRLDSQRRRLGRDR
jgi:hypothetical protein